MHWGKALLALGALFALSEADQRGPDPTESALERDGPFEIRTITLGDSETPGFGAATIYVPEDTSGGPFAGVSMSPGFTSTQRTMAWFARRVASHGFVVINTNTNSRTDFPRSRGTQTLAALRFLASDSPVANIVDGDRLGAMGYSMGGGGALQAAASDGSIGAVVAIAPWNTIKDWSESEVPTFIFGIQGDTIAPVRSHSETFFSTVGGAKAYAEMRGGTHTSVIRPNAALSKYAVSWLKTFLEDDSRYTSFICEEIVDAALSEFRAECSLDEISAGGKLHSGLAAAGAIIAAVLLA